MKRSLILLLVLGSSGSRIFSEKIDQSESNRLIHEKSPYLLQHAFNPVDWYPWGKKAFKVAQEQNKPIFLSVGYSTCYWCHVMEREVFEDQEIANLMNQFFVNVKVDREERPDVDRIYMQALQTLTGRGGWPMSMFLTPNLEPFHGETYVPPMYFRALIKSVHQTWITQPDKITRTSQKITQLLRDGIPVEKENSVVEASILEKGYRTIRSGFDRTFGGFGIGNKFPRPVVFNFLLRYQRSQEEEQALYMVITTLRRIAAGGIFDQLGGGFHRYSVDQQWRVPHFEKMLYDQAQMVNSYLDAYQVTQDELFGSIARKTLEYVNRHLRHETGGFYSAEDSESVPDPSRPLQKREGAFYVWTSAEIDRVLGTNRSPIFDYHFGIGLKGNALDDPHEVFVGQNILYQAHSLEDTANKFDQSRVQVSLILEESCRLLLQTRKKRLRPHLDDKILVSWNGLMISAFARAYQVLGDIVYLEKARQAADFILSNLYQKKTGRLLRRFRQGEARFEAHLEDYACLVKGLLDLYEASFEVDYLKQSVNLTMTAIELFYDEKSGAFFDTSGRDKSLIIRTQESYDGAEPSGSSVIVWNLLRLAKMIRYQEWQQMATSTFEQFGSRLREHPEHLPHMLAALDFHLGTPKEVVFVGTQYEKSFQALVRAVHSVYVPNKVILFADGGAGQEFLGRRNPAIRAMRSLEGKATAFVCENYVCQLPTSDPDILVRQLKDKGESLQTVVFKDNF